MADFPETTSKLSAPSKKSQFERQKAEAEAKKAREKAETAAVLAEFEKSFDDEDEPSVFQSASRGPPAPGKRHFSGIGLKSGPGTLGKAGPGSLGPTYNKKRPFDDHAERRDRGGYRPERRDSRNHEEQEEEKAAKPTLHLSSMPPTISAAFIKGLFAHTPLNVENVRILPAVAPSGPAMERKSCSAIVTLATETAATDIDTAVSHLQNKYLGFGFKLSISRHLSSAALGNTAISSTNVNALPFGARPIPQHTSLSRAPPPNQRFAPPQFYTSSVPYTRGPPTQVTVQSPSNLKQLKLIHKTLEALLTYGPEFEALLMSRSEIQRDERWAWLWDSSSVGGVYYRWRLWEILTNATKRRHNRSQGQETLFEGQSVWQPPEESLRFEYATQLEEFVSDEDYNSSDEEDNDDGAGGSLVRRYNDHNVPALNAEEVNDGVGYLDPLAKAKLVHLLSRLPSTNTKLRRGDVARITAFAIEHAGAGGEEVAVLITRNILRPFSKPEGEDTTSASMVGLYVVSDILSSSANAGVRHAWRYRTLFEHALRQQKVFNKLGRAEKDYKWGKLKGEKWKRSVQNLLTLWEGWSVFPQATQGHFTTIFNDPPLTEEEKRAAEEADTQKSTPEDNARAKTTSRWRTVDEEAGPDVKMDDVDGVPMPNDEDMSASDLENIDGVPMVDSSDEESDPTTQRVSQIPETAQSDPPDREIKSGPKTTNESPTITMPGPRKQRPRAADMFADDSD
ncbi:hypothetical protein LTS08_000862 [Lithohypha guttulata]|uniref:uncharacterized protein n=1 Tax=Lithohypha guttulata TaxID=1690604 RepID=UPI002DE1EC0A|nr:hypothetical protein LTR51_006524 [Lithohypha guttulata]KAK5106740.1 hypothetical protein LTS08_000862 [Lithohypha guttulata]